MIARDHNLVGNHPLRQLTAFNQEPTIVVREERWWTQRLLYGIGAGLFVFTTDFSGLYVEANYLRAESSGSKADYNGTEYSFNSDLSQIDIHAGIRILVGGSSE